MKEKIRKISEGFKNLTPTAQGMIILGILLIIGIILRWNFILEEIGRGFNFFSGK
jgi:hypothetical protein